MKKIALLMSLIVLVFSTTIKSQSPLLDLEDRYKKASMKPYYDYGYYYVDRNITANELAKSLDIPLETVHQLAVEGILAALDFSKPFNDGFTQENYDAYRAPIDYFFDNPDKSSRDVKVQFKNKEIGLVLFMPIIMANNMDSTPSLPSDMKYMHQHIWRQSSNIEGYEVYVKKGQDWRNTAKQLKLSIANLLEYNPSIQMDATADTDYIICIPNTPKHNGGKFAWSDMNQTQQYEILDSYASCLINGNLDTPLSLKEKLKLGASLYHYDRETIEDEPFWSINNIHNNVTANQISQTVGISPDQLKLYCKYASALKDDESTADRGFDAMRLYFLDHPDITIEQLAQVSQAKYNGKNYRISLYIPERPSDIRLNDKGEIIYPAVVPSQIKSKKTLKQFFSNSPSFKCSQAEVTLTLSYNTTDGFVAFVDGKRLGRFEVDTREEEPQKALIGLPWLRGWGPAPMLLTLAGVNSTLALLPVQGEEMLKYNSQGYLQHGRTGNTNWMKLSLSSDGISFDPLDYRPDPEMFRFIGFSKKS